MPKMDTSLVKIRETKRGSKSVIFSSVFRISDASRIRDKITDDYTFTMIDQLVKEEALSCIYGLKETYKIRKR